MPRLLQSATIAALFCFASQMPAQVLYDAALGTTPNSQGWTHAVVGSATQTMTNAAVQFDTTPLSPSTQGGYSRLAPVALDGTNGFTLLFTAQLSREIHQVTNRAGFSVIILDQSKRGLELAFWTNAVWAQADSPLFTHGETAAFAATNFADYALTFHATNYVLRANGATILTGPVRNYTAFSGFLDPYETANFIFFGDDTTSASAVVSLRKITLVTPPVLHLAGDLVLRWDGVSHLTYTVQTSSNLVDWTVVDAVGSATGSFRFTNTALPTPQFFRVLYP